MKNAFRISVTNPCSEKFDTFEKTAMGGYCNSCEKEVIDFTAMSDDVIFDFFKNKTASSCGRFRSSQLKIYEPVHTIKMNHSIFSKQFATVGFSLLALCAVSNLQAQDVAMNTPKVQTEITVSQPLQTDIPQEKEYTVKGVVLDEENLPLSGASVVLKNTDVGVATDFDGKFEFPKTLKADDVLVFSYIGYDTKEYIIKAGKSELIDIKINFTNTDMILMGDVVVGGIHKSKRNIFQKIGDLFR